MKKKQNWLYGLIMVLLFPLFVRAESDFTVYDAFMVELFTSIHAAVPKFHELWVPFSRIHVRSFSTLTRIANLLLVAKIWE